MNEKKDTIEVLHEKDLGQFLKELEIYDDFINKKIMCKYCNNSITNENLCGIFLLGEEIEFICNKKLCYNKFLQLKEENGIV